jgi:hypothetical protein
VASDIKPELLQDMPPNTPLPALIGTNDNGTNGNSHPDKLANEEASNESSVDAPEEEAAIENNEQTEIKDVEEAVKPQKPANGKCS